MTAFSFKIYFFKNSDIELKTKARVLRHRGIPDLKGIPNLKGMAPERMSRCKAPSPPLAVYSASPPIEIYEECSEIIYDDVQINNVPSLKSSIMASEEYFYDDVSPVKTLNSTIEVSDAICCDELNSLEEEEESIRPLQSYKKSMNNLFTEILTLKKVFPPSI